MQGMLGHMRPKDDQNFWNFWLLMLSAILLVAEVWVLDYFGRIPTDIIILDLVLITLATFRLTRLFVYDTIMQFVRDWFLDRKVTYTEDNRIIIERKKYQDGFSRAMSDLFSCPWCFGLQAAMLVVFIYYLTPLSWIIILMFAVGGTATFIQLIANATGWKAEYLKRQTESTYSDERLKGSSDGRCG
jgi:hypothetical protein